MGKPGKGLALFEGNRKMLKSLSRGIVGRYGRGISKCITVAH